MQTNVSKQGGVSYQEEVGCIEVGDNVFIGAGTTILKDVHIGSNVIIAAESVVVQDIPSNSVVAGVPAKVIETMDEYLEKLAKIPRYPEELTPKRQTISHAFADFLWADFHQRRKVQN